MNKLLPKTILFFGLFIAAITVLWLPTEADDEPTAVSLIYFDAVPLNNAVRLDWETASELNTLGYRIKRAVPGGSAVYLDYVGDNGFIPGIGGVAVGGFYTVTDNRVQNGEVYTYILMEVETSGNEKEEDRETVTVGIQPTNTPVSIVNPGGGSTTSTATAKPGASAGSTATPTQSANQIPTSTPSGFVTITPNSKQPVASPTPNSGTNNTNQTSGSITNTSSDTSRPEVTSNTSFGGVTEVSAQEEVLTEEQSSQLLAPQTQDDYPGEEPTATAVSDSSETYPDNTTSYIDSQSQASPTPVTVIGSTNGYSGAQAEEPTSSNAAASQGRVFLWIGFIVALLIFTTGLIGSILLFTRKSN